MICPMMQVFGNKRSSKVKKSDVFVYIAGKYSDSTMLQTEQHVLDASELAIKCSNAGIKFFCPHTHSKFFDFYAPDVSWEYWMNLDFHVIRKLTNCMLMVSNYGDSKGAKMEMQEARDLGHFIFFEFLSLLRWYSDLED